MNTTNLISKVLLIVSTLLVVSYCMPEPDAQSDYDSNYGVQGQRFGRGRYGLNNYQTRFGLNQRLGRGLYSPSIGQYYSPYYYYYYPYYSPYYYNNPYLYSRYLGYYPGYGGYGQGLYSGYGLYNRNRVNNGNGFDNYGNGMVPRDRDSMSGRYDGSNDYNRNDQSFV